jgi:hypothetical protein
MDLVVQLLEFFMHVFPDNVVPNLDGVELAQPTAQTNSSRNHIQQFQ